MEFSWLWPNPEQKTNPTSSKASFSWESFTENPFLCAKIYPCIIIDCKKEKKTMENLNKKGFKGNGNPLQYSCLENPMDGGAWWAAVYGVAQSWTWLSDFTFTFHFHALEKEMATHSSVLAWRIPGMGEPGGLLSMGLHRIGHNWSDLAAARVKSRSWDQWDAWKQQA